MTETQTVAAPTPPSTAQPAVVVSNVVKTYGSVRAVDNLSFTVQHGEIFSLLGPNGAGKSTTVEMLEGYRRPDSGQVRVLGYDPIKQGAELKQHMGLMLQATALYQEIEVKEALDLFASYYKDPRSPQDLLKLVGLQDHQNTKFSGLSGGQKQRLSMALALTGKPSIVFLDEPTAAMDPQMRHQTWDIIKGLQTAGVTVLMTTHFMDEAQELSDHVAIIDHGKLIAFGTPEELMGNSASEVISFGAPPNIDLAALQKLQGADAARQDKPGAYSIVTSDPLNCVAALAAWSHQGNVKIDGLRVAGATLEDIFLQLTGKEVRD